MNTPPNIEESFTEFEDVPKTPPENLPHRPRWYRPTTESANWSQNVFDFYYNGEASFCYNGFLGNKPLGQEFWGTLLGYQSYGYLSSFHGGGWVKRLMMFHWKEITKCGQPFPWTILPPHFFDLLSETPNYGALPFAIGMRQVYPPLWDIDTVYIPISIQQRDWFLIQVDMQKLGMHLYFTGSYGSSGSNQHTIIQVLAYPVLIKFETLFKSFLDNISCWENSGRFFVDKLRVSGTTVWPGNGGNVGCNYGVLVCMLRRNLVLNLPINIEEDLQDACANYRRFMATEFYSARWLSNQ